jgi:hypothetical protein
MLEKEPIFSFVGNDLIYTSIDAGIYVRGGAQFVDEESKVPIGSRAVHFENKTFCPPQVKLKDNKMKSF